MSSIISDIFYGSKQNLLDNYLIHRFDKEPSLSGPQQHLQKMTAVYSSALHFTITILVAQDFQQKSFGIKVQLGKKIEEVFAAVGGKKRLSQIYVELNDLDNVDLSKYSNIKITISEGKYKEKVFGYIPIQTIKSMMAQQGSQKTITLPVKGKRFIGFSSVKCNIKADFSQNILNSNILGSIDKDNSEMSHLNFRSRENQIEEMSGIQEQPNVQIYKITNVRKYERKDVQKSNLKSRNQSQSYIIEKQNYHKKIDNKLKSTSQFIKQVLPVPAIFSKIKLNKLNYAQEKIKLSQNGFIFTLGEEVKLRNITQQGVNVDLYADEVKIGTIHLNALLLTITDFKGELPIYDQNQQCVGTILVCSPSTSLNTQTLSWKSDKGKRTQIIKPEEVSLQQRTVLQRDIYKMLVLSIKKIVMTNLSKELINGSVDNANQLKAEFFNFVKMEACGRLELIVRLNHQMFKFKDISLRYIIDSQQIQVVQLKRRQGFTIVSWQQAKGNQNILEMELYSNHRLLCYSKNTFGMQTTATHHFTAAKTDFAFSQSAIYCSYIQLQAHQEYFQMSRLSQIMNILQQLIDGQLRLIDLSDESIKQIMNINKKIAYVEVKKLFNLMQPHFKQFMEFQQKRINTVIGEQTFNNELITQMNAKLLRQFALSDVQNESSIDQDQFQKIVNFFTNQSVSEIQQSWNKLKTCCIKNIEGRVLYPLFVAGFYLHSQPKKNHQKNQPSHQNDSNLNRPTLIYKKTFQVDKEVIVTSQQRYFLQSIQFRNLHMLNLGKIPNVMLSIAIKTHYSNANPEFIIDKTINVMEPIKIYHKNIAQNSMQLLAEFMPLRRKSLYQLDPSGKVTAKLIWGNSNQSQ